MASPKAMAMTNVHLPEDVIVQILYRLPVKPLVRFRCVSKRWSSIVSDPQFVKSHFKFACERKALSHRLLLYNRDRLKSFDLQSPSFPDDSSVRELTASFKLYMRHFWFMGSCNGMVFVITGDHVEHGSYIWNPSTGLFLKLGFASNGITSGSDTVHCGFGYVSATDDYKVVVAGEFRNPTITVEMYSSKANSWKNIESQPHFSSSKEYVTHPKGTLLNEALHWLVLPYTVDSDTEDPADPADREGEGKPTIIAFDLAKEKFRKMPLPLLKEDDETNDFFWTVGLVSGGCLCVASYVGDVPYVEIIQLWSLMDYDVSESWTKLVKVVGSQLSPPFVYRERSLFLLRKSERALVKFDHKEEEKLDEVTVCSGLVGSYDVIEYAESLLWFHDYPGGSKPNTSAEEEEMKRSDSFVHSHAQGF